MLVVIDEESDRLNRLIAQATQMGQLEASSMRMEVAARPGAGCRWPRIGHPPVRPQAGEQADGADTPRRQINFPPRSAAHPRPR